MHPSAIRLFLIGVVPLIASLIAVRQLYLQYTNDLSLWLGGGMGMFAGMDVPQLRILKIYLSGQNHIRQPVLSLTRYQNKLRLRAIAEPTQNNLAVLAKSIADTRWRRQSGPLGQIIDSHGATAGPMDRRFDILLPQGPRARKQGPPAKIEVNLEFWKTAYDPATGKLSARFIKGLEHVGR